MRRFRAVLVLLAGLGVIPGALAGQSVYFELSGDSAVALRAGRSVDVDLYAYNPTFNGVKAYSVTLLLDGARLQVASAAEIPGYSLGPPTVTPLATSDSVTIQAAGTGLYGYYIPLARVRLALAGGAVEGSLVHVRVNTLTDYYGTDLLPNHRTTPLEVCQAIKTWGDVDNNDQVNSRDALVALSKAVGLSVTGFDLTVGDVDGDGDVTSRDALFIMAQGIGLNLGGRAGHGVPNRCAPLLPAPADLVFVSGAGIETVPAGDTVRTLLSLGAGATAPAGYLAPRWSPDGSKIAYQCADGNTDICIANADGTGAYSLGLDVGAAEAYPRWSPDGSRILFVRGGYQLWTANAADGSGQLQIAGSVYASYGAWGPDGTQIAFTGMAGGCCTQALWVVNVDGTGLTALPGGSGLNPYEVSWNAAGDSLVFRGSNARLFRTALNAVVAGSTFVPTNGYQYQPDWEAPGIAFQSYVTSPSQVLFRRPTDGRVFRLTRAVVNNGDNTMPDLRPASSHYVNTVTISGTLSFTYPGTTSLSASVLYNDASPSAAPVTWSSLNTGVATVDGTGLVTGVSPGTADIVASVRGWRADTVTVTVN